MKSILTYSMLALFIALSSCNESTEKITNPEDYNAFLGVNDRPSEDLAKKDFTFWNEKLAKAPNQFPYLVKMAAAKSQLFGATGKIENLIAAENFLVGANTKTNYNNASYLRALARNYISQHRFKEALELLEKAEANGEKLKYSQKMLFDVHLELGNYAEAQTYLSKFKNFSDFDYLIRLSKWSDHQGNLSAAIGYMEKALRIAEGSNNKALMQWSYTNLADFYGHDNRIKASYNYYLKALQLDPNDAYAKKGISWIVYSYERQPEEALRILDSITKQHHSPDYFLLKAEIAEFMEDLVEKENNIQRYLAAVNNKQYGVMYNKHNTLLLVEELKNQDEALRIANAEISQRPTPQSYDLLAWAYHKNGDNEKALQIVEDKIANKTFEPEAQYHMAEIYKANGREKVAMKLKKELLESAYELGPVMERRIKQL